MRLNYPSIGDSPIIVVLVEDLLAGGKHVFPMLLDTGADDTSFPARYAAFFGHDNANRGVARKNVCGVGGAAVAYIHSVRINLLDPVKTTGKRFVTAWSSALCTASFIDGLNTPMGLIGRDLMRQWKRTTFRYTPANLRSQWRIEIEL